MGALSVECAVRLPVVRRIWLALWVALFVAASAGLAVAQDRVALVIGNSSYTRLGTLKNPRNDAADMAAALRGIGFQVVSATDVGGREFGRIVSEFSRLAQRADVALFYFAGHGLQFQSENYLIPVDAELDYELALRQTMALNDVIAALGGARTSLIFIDACRSFPVDETFLAASNERGPTTVGLAKLETAKVRNSFVAFAASAGQTANDGIGRNSPFTSAMLELLPRRGVDVNAMFSEIIARVRIATDGRQSPQAFNGISGSLVLNPGAEMAPADIARVAERDFDRAARVGTITAYRAFLSEHPGGFYAQLAKEQIAALEASDAGGVVADAVAVQPDIQSGAGADQANSGDAAVPSGDDHVAAIAPAEVVASQSLLLEAADSGKGAVPFAGTMSWSKGKDEHGRPTLIGRANIPGRNIAVDVLIRKNSEPSLPASHLMEINFVASDSFVGGSISGLAGVLLKNERLVQGEPLTGASARVVGNSFLFALSAAPEDAAANTTLMVSRKWMDLALIYATGKRAIMTLEKDGDAQRLFEEVFASWAAVGALTMPPGGSLAAAA